ncbi:MAG TPA: hypothetical protein VG796_14195 [Verrucomicrobiales bacterium]|jgi:hypothetical protein|nr:hypothetical protein [Verrucomicrobiales bacterium]
MDKLTFAARLHQVTHANRQFAARFVSNILPESSRYIVRLNQSYDGNLTPGERVFPGETDPVAPLAAADVVELLCRDNCVPEWIDISVERADLDHTYFELLCCGRFTDNESFLYYNETGNAPFGSKGPCLPPFWSEEQGKFDLQ